MMFAPTQLPFAPRPLAAEVLSSWLLRVASANFMLLDELLDALEGHYGRLFSCDPIDLSFPVAAVHALSQFCRIAPEKIRALDFRQQVPLLNPTFLLRFRDSVLPSSRCWPRRVCYAYCPSCIASQQVIHVRWDWCLAWLVSCTVHRTPLRDGCTVCGEQDPLTFSGFDPFPNRLCRSCGSDLAEGVVSADEGRNESPLQPANDACLTMFVAAAPDATLLKFVEEMFQLLTRNLNPCPSSRKTRLPSFSRQDIAHIIGTLILNVAPCPDRSQRRAQYARGITLWATLMSIVPHWEGTALERASICWSPALRRRFASALRHRTRRRWPYHPWQKPMTMDERRADLAKVAAVFRTSAPGQHRGRQTAHSVRDLTPI